jgi:hypothetical protein
MLLTFCLFHPTILSIGKQKICHLGSQGIAYADKSDLSGYLQLVFIFGQLMLFHFSSLMKGNRLEGTYTTASIEQIIKFDEMVSHPE